ncbi:MAG: transposase, partial [Pseudomonadota bacterium]
MEGKHLPKHVIEEFEAFLRCGVLAYGFVRLRCEKCHHERIAALSCKKRGICSSCGGRRMAETAAHLVDHVFPRVGVRQWVISFPFQIRYLLARNPKIQSRCLEIVLRAISALIKKKLRKQGATGQLQTGAVTIIQRAGGSINLNPHLHMLVLDGAYSHGEEGNPPRFHWLQSLTDDDVKALIKTIALRVVRHLKRHGHFRDDTQYVADEDTPSGDVMAELQAASVQSKIALGKKKGQKVKRLGSLGKIIDINPETKAPLCAAIEGFSLHAGVYCSPSERKKLEKVARYIARPAVAEDRLRFDSRGDIMYKLKHPYTDGTSILMFSPLEFLEKIAALIP